jgi:amino acid permease
MSPGGRILFYAGSPGRYIKTKMAPGSVNSSIFSLVIICLGTGTLTIPYVFYELGFGLGLAALIFGGLISGFSAYLLAYCAFMTKGTSFEEIALVTFGKRGQHLTTFCMVGCNIGFTVSYIITVSAQIT